MILGIGVDMADITEIARLSEGDEGEVFVRHTFTERERATADAVPHRAEYLATRFAAKEAVFKAVAHLLPEKSFDLRIVETLDNDDGSPYVHVTDDLAPVLAKAGVQRIFVSITTESGLATCFVVVEG